MIAKKFLKHILLFSGVTAIFIILFFLLMTMFGIQFFDGIYKFDFWLPLPFMMITFYYCKKVNHDHYPFQESIIVGSVFLGAVVFLAPFVVFLLTEFAFQDFLQESILLKTKELREALLLKSEEKQYIKEQLEALKYTSSFTIASDMFIRLLLVSMMYNMILSVLFRTTEK